MNRCLFESRKSIHLIKADSSVWTWFYIFGKLYISWMDVTKAISSSFRERKNENWEVRRLWYLRSNMAVLLCLLCVWQQSLFYSSAGKGAELSLPFQSTYQSSRFMFMYIVSPFSLVQQHEQSRLMPFGPVDMWMLCFLFFSFFWEKCECSVDCFNVCLFNCDW